MFSFTVGWISIGYEDPHFEGFLNLSRYQITDANGELADFDYDNPTADPFNGELRLEGFLCQKPDHRYGGLALLRVGGQPTPQKVEPGKFDKSIPEMKDPSD